MSLQRCGPLLRLQGCKLATGTLQAHNVTTGGLQARRQIAGFQERKGGPAHVSKFLKQDRRISGPGPPKRIPPSQARKLAQPYLSKQSCVIRQLDTSTAREGGKIPSRANDPISGAASRPNASRCRGRPPRWRRKRLLRPEGRRTTRTCLSPPSWQMVWRYGP